MSDNLPEKNQFKLEILPANLKFQKRSGTTDLGKDYEEYFPSWVILELLQNKEVKDFCISTNDAQFGAFDDFILEIEYTNKPAEKYAVQLKHKKNDCIRINHFKSKKSEFYLQKYYTSFKKHYSQLSNYDIILFTNATFKIENNMVIDVGNDKESVNVKIIECTPSSVINTSKNGISYQFQLDPGNSEEIKLKYKNFFEQFFLYSNQMNTHQLYNNIPEQLEILTQGSPVADKFLKFISHWSLTDGIKNKLTKDLVVKVLTLNMIDELIHPYIFCKINEKQKIFQKAISFFNISVFNKESLKKIVKIWGDAKSILRKCDIKKINEIRKHFQISTRYIQDIDDLTEKESTKLLWVMDICPLIVTAHPTTYEAAKLCGKKSKFVFITDNLHEEKLEQLTVFKTLRDLKRHQPTYYNDVVKNFTFTLFEEKSSFEKLIKEDNAFENLITTDEIAKVTDNTDLIRLEEEKLCFPYVKRHLFKNIIDFKYLQKLDEETMVLISNVSDETKLKDGLQNFEIVSIIDELHENADGTNSTKKKFHISNDTSSKNYEQLSIGTDRSREEFNNQFDFHICNSEGISMNETTSKLQNDADISKNKKKIDSVSLKKYKLFFNKTEASPQEFKKLCNKQKKYRKYHHLRYNGKSLEWIESIGDVSELQKFSIVSETFIDNEEKYVENITNKLNIVIGDPGMGKSLFVKKLKNNLLSKYLPVMILPTDVPMLCQFLKHSKNVHKFFAFILETKFSEYGNFERQVLKLLMENKKAIFFWDALDELKEQDRILIEKLILTLRENSVAQFLTSRGFLRKQLEDKFNVLCKELQPFVDKEQTNYIQERLKKISSNENLKAIITSIKKNIADTSYRDILGVPLQIYMLTELFLQDFAKYKKLLGDFFVITDLYFHFIEEKFNSYFIAKKQFPYNYKEIPFIKRSLSRQMKHYQKVALKSIFGTTFSLEGTDSNFLNEIKDEGDEFGFITAVDANMQPEFLHNSYAEYFAATYLAENCGNISNMAIIFERKYTNVKYFFDLLLAKNSPVHIAVLCKNIKYLQNYNGRNELKTKDLQGRNALHLAASWGEKYPLLETSEISDDSTLSQKLKEVNNSIIGCTILINDDINYETKKESTEYHQIMNILLENCDPNEIDELFNFTSLMYAEKSGCLFTAAIIGKTKNESYLKTKDESFIISLLYYAIKYEFTDIVDLFGDLKFIINKNGNAMLHTVAAINQFEYLRKLLSQEVYRQNTNYRNLAGDTALMTAAENGHLETVKYLKQQNAKVDAAGKDGFTPLMAAAQDGHLETVKYLIEQSANVNATANQGQTPLYLAAKNGHFETVKYLKQQNSNVDAADIFGFTPLMEAAQNGHLETVEYLIEQHTNVNAVTNEGYTPLYLAAFNGHLETVKYLQQQNARVDAVNKNGFTPLMAAAQDGHFKTVKYLTEQSANVNAAANQEQTPLYLAAVNGHLEIVKYLKQQNAKVDAAMNDGFTPLMIAAQNGHHETVKYLIEQSANVNAAANQGQTPLYLAAFDGHIETVKYLKQQNAKVDAAMNDGFTPLMIAAQNGHHETVKYLIEQSANVNAAANQGQTPLYLAAFDGHIETVKYLKQQNAKVDTEDKDGFTPLMVAAQEGHLKTVKYLIEQSANVNATDNEGQTPLHLAAFCGHLETVKYLKQQNAKVDAAKKNGVTPLMCAAQKGHLETVKYLIEQRANVNAADINRRTPLLLAALTGHHETVKYLVQQSANVNAAAIQGVTPLYLAAQNGSFETVKYLKQQNAKVDAALRDGFTPLMIAVQNGHPEIVKYLIEQSANVNAAANEGQTPLYLAALDGHLETVKYLKQQNAKVDAVKGDGFTPLMIAAQNGHFETVKYLIEQSANVNATANQGQTPLYLAALNGHLETVKYLTQHNAKVDAAIKDGFTPLMIAAQNGHLETVKYLKQQKAKVDATDKYGFTPLMAAAYVGHLEIVKYLIEQSANVNAAANQGQTPFYLAALNGHLETVHYLKKQKAKVYSAKKNGFTPIIVAAQNGHFDTVQYLIQQGANYNAAANQGQTPLYLAALNGHFETVKYLNQQKAKVDAADKNGFTPLMAAAQDGHFKTVKYLIEQNANVNAAANQEQTPLYLAAKNGHLEIVKYLKQQNAKVDAAMKDGFTPLMIAAQNGHHDTVKYLVEQSANVNAAANQGQTPLYLAALNGHLETVKYLKQQKAKVDAADKNGFTPLMAAAYDGHLETVKYLTHQSANVNAAANQGQTPLYLAAKNEHHEIVKYLKQQNAKLDTAYLLLTATEEDEDSKNLYESGRSRHRGNRLTTCILWFRRKFTKNH